MEPIEADEMARDYLDKSPGLSAESGFEIIDRSRFDFKEWEVKCRIFSSGLSRMVEYVVVISDDVVIAARAI